MGTPRLHNLVKLMRTGERMISVQRRVLSRDVTTMTCLHLQKVSGVAARG